MRLCWGRLKSRKKRKNFGAREIAHVPSENLGFEQFFGVGPIFRKKQQFQEHSAVCAVFSGAATRTAGQTLGTVRMLSGLRS